MPTMHVTPLMISFASVAEYRPNARIGTLVASVTVTLPPRVLEIVNVLRL